MTACVSPLTACLWCMSARTRQFDTSALAVISTLPVFFCSCLVFDVADRLQWLEQMAGSRGPVRSVLLSSVDYQFTVSHKFSTNCMDVVWIVLSQLVKFQRRLTVVYIANSLGIIVVSPLQVIWELVHFCLFITVFVWDDLCYKVPTTGHGWFGLCCLEFALITWGVTRLHIIVGLVCELSCPVKYNDGCVYFYV